MDTYSKERITKLHPSVRDEITKIITQCNHSLNGRAKVRIAQGLRSFKEQEELYSIGRTKPGKKITNARSGQSVHNYGLAVDICLIIDGKTASWNTVKDWDNDRIADWYECVRIFALHGWDWGGNWKTFKDLSHFEKKGYSDWRKLKSLPIDKTGYVKL